MQALDQRERGHEKQQKEFTPDLQFQLPNITHHEIFRKLRTLPKPKSVGGDITNVILREVAPVITQSLCHLFNTSLRLGQLPSDWKLATVIPIYKENCKPAEPGSYRPISLLLAIAKILDAIHAEHLTSFLNRQGLITDHQYGFVSCKSTLDQLIVLSSRVAKALHKRTDYHALFLDFAKAFDKVPHPVLLRQLATIISPEAVSWFTNNLRDRSFCVKVLSPKSPTHPVSAGVPEGSHLGPIRFILCINALTSTISSDVTTDVLLSADDTTLGRAVGKPNQQQMVHPSRPPLMAFCSGLTQSEGASTPRSLAPCSSLLEVVQNLPTLLIRLRT